MSVKTAQISGGDEPMRPEQVPDAAPARPEWQWRPQVETRRPKQIRTQGVAVDLVSATSHLETSDILRAAQEELVSNRMTLVSRA